MINIVHGSLLDQNVDVIVNAANAKLMGGGGIDGLIHHTAGSKLMKFLRRHYPNGVETGSCVLSPGFDLKHRHIIHTAGPVWYGGDGNEDVLLEDCYFNALHMACDYEFESIAFCSISTGIYGYPIELACPVALETIQGFLDAYDDPIDVTIALYGDEEFEVYSRFATKLQNPLSLIQMVF